jgi:hypothetical protein
LLLFRTPWRPAPSAGGAPATAHAPHEEALAETTASAQLSLLLCAAFLLFLPSVFTNDPPASSRAGMTAELALACAYAWVCARAVALIIILSEYMRRVSEHGFEGAPSLPELDAQLGAAALRAVRSVAALRWLCVGGGMTCTCTILSLLLFRHHLSTLRARRLRPLPRAAAGRQLQHVSLCCERTIWCGTRWLTWHCSVRCCCARFGMRASAPRRGRGRSTRTWGVWFG